MKKKILGIAMIVVIALVASWSLNQSKSDVMLSDIALSNVEALANWEVGIGTICATTCSNCWCYYPPCCGSSDNDYWADGEPYN